MITSYEILNQWPRYVLLTNKSRNYIISVDLIATWPLVCLTQWVICSSANFDRFWYGVEWYERYRHCKTFKCFLRWVWQHWFTAWELGLPMLTTNADRFCYNDRNCINSRGKTEAWLRTNVSLVVNFVSSSVNNDLFDAKLSPITRRRKWQLCFEQ